MTSFNDYLYPLNEVQVRLYFDGESFYLDGFPQEAEPAELPEVCKRGVRAIFNLMENMVPGLTCLIIQGVWFHKQENPFVAFSIWLQHDPEGFYMPMASAASLFQENGIPYFHQPLI